MVSRNFDVAWRYSISRIDVMAGKAKEIVFFMVLVF